MRVELAGHEHGGLQADRARCGPRARGYLPRRRVVQRLRSKQVTFSGEDDRPRSGQRGGPAVLFEVPVYLSI